MLWRGVGLPETQAIQGSLLFLFRPFSSSSVRFQAWLHIRITGEEGMTVGEGGLNHWRPRTNRSEFWCFSKVPWGFLKATWAEHQGPSSSSERSYRACGWPIWVEEERGSLFFWPALPKSFTTLKAGGVQAPLWLKRSWCLEASHWKPLFPSKLISDPPHLLTQGCRGGGRSSLTTLWSG